MPPSSHNKFSGKLKKTRVDKRIPCRVRDISTSQLTRVIEKTLTGTVVGFHAFGYDPAGNMTTMQKSGGTPNVVFVTTRAHNPLNQVTGLSGGGATLVRGVLNEPGSASIAKAGQPLVPARMTAGNTFEDELNLSTGQNTVTRSRAL